jgi:hypothetical protein
MEFMQQFLQAWNFIIDNPINGSLGGYDYELKD